MICKYLTNILVWVRCAGMLIGVSSSDAVAKAVHHSQGCWGHIITDDEMLCEMQEAGLMARCTHLQSVKCYHAG